MSQEKLFKNVHAIMGYFLFEFTEKFQSSLCEVIYEMFHISAIDGFL